MIDRKALASCCVVVLGMAMLVACGGAPTPATESGDGEDGAPASEASGGPPAAASVVQRGEYLAAAGACSDCHTPMKMGANGPEPDLSRFMSGHPESEVVDSPPPPTEHSTPTWMWSQSNTVFMGGFGTSYAINLTPDEATGIGSWTEDIFVQAIKSGKHWGASRPILPPMPWQSYAQLTDDDLKAMFAYLKSIPAIVNRVPEAQPAPPPAPPAVGVPPG